MAGRPWLVAGLCVTVVGSALLAAAVARWSAPAPAPAPPDLAGLDPGRLLARVDGHPLYEREVGIDPEAPIANPPLHVDFTNFARLRREAAAPLVEAGIDEYLLHREALRQGLDRDPDFLRRRAELRALRAAERRTALAGLAERALRRHFAETLEVSEEEIQRHLDATQRSPDLFGMDRDLTPESAAAMLRRNKADAACQQTLYERTLDAGLTVDGVGVERERLVTLLRPHVPAVQGSGAPQAASGDSLHALLLAASARRSGLREADLVADVERFAALFAETRLQLGEHSLLLGAAGCERYFEGQPGPGVLGLRAVDPHGLSFCIHRALQVELLVADAERAGLQPPGEQGAALRFAALERQALVELLLLRAGVYADSLGVGARRAALVRALRATALVELLY